MTELIKALYALRAELKKAKQFAFADMVRRILEKHLGEDVVARDREKKGPLR